MQSETGTIGLRSDFNLALLERRRLPGLFAKTLAAFEGAGERGQEYDRQRETRTRQDAPKYSRRSGTSWRRAA